MHHDALMMMGWVEMLTKKKIIKFYLIFRLQIYKSWSFFTPEFKIKNNNFNIELFVKVKNIVSNSGPSQVLI